MKNRSIRLTSLICTFILLLLPLVNPVVVSARQTAKESPLQSNTIRNIDPLTAGSEMGPIATGWYHACALTPAGGVLCWGRNDYGQLGDNSTIDSLVPVHVVGLSSGVSAIAAGRWHTCALTTTGGVLCWGGNLLGQLGDHSFFNSLTPVSVWGLSSGVSAIAAGFYHTCALTTDGTMLCWGHNGYGQLGNNLNTPSIPVAVSGLPGAVSAIAAGFYHTCAVTSAGGAMCWGRNDDGQLGNDSTTNSPTPVNVYGLSSGVSAITTGDWHTCALTSTGVKCWGMNNSGQIGNDSVTKSLIPMNVSALTSAVSAIVAGGAHTCALTTPAQGMKCWGDNDIGQLGNNSSGSYVPPVNVYGLSSGVSAITTGQYFTCALTTSGVKKCWGSNSYGQLGNNSTLESHIPVDVAEPAPPRLAINYPTGQSGSYFTFTGDHFPFSSTVSISINGYVLTNTLPVDATGQLKFLITTSLADMGLYAVAALPAGGGVAEAGLGHMKASAAPHTVAFILDASAPLRPQSGSGQIFSVPAGIALSARWLYLSLLVR